METLLSVIRAALNTCFCQSVFPVPNNAFCAVVPFEFTTARYSSPFKTSAYFAIVDNEFLVSKTTFNLSVEPPSPFLVVINITPFAPREP